MTIHYTLGPLTIDTEQRILKLGDDRVPLAHRPTSILLLLLASAGKVISRETIRTAIWPETHIDDAVITRNISLIRCTLEPHMATSPIETISKMGYRYKGPVSRH